MCVCVCACLSVSVCRLISSVSVCFSISILLLGRQVEVFTQVRKEVAYNENKNIKRERERQADRRREGGRGGFLFFSALPSSLFPCLLKKLNFLSRFPQSLDFQKKLPC